MPLRNFAPTPTLLQVLLVSLLLGAYSALAVWLGNGVSIGLGENSVGLEAALSLVMGLIMAFRVNRAFDRWWEGRTLWGTLVNASRNLAVKAHNLVAETSSDESVSECHDYIIAFAVSLKDHLRKEPSSLNLAQLKQLQSPPKHVPVWIANQIYGLIESWKQAGRIDYAAFRALDLEAKVLLEVCGGCERIRNTPIARSFRAALLHAVALYLATLPWTIVDDLGVWTIPATFLTAYFILAADGIAAHLEEPFQRYSESLDLESICTAIEVSVNEIRETTTVSTPAADASSSI